MDANGRLGCAFVGESGLLDGGGCGGIRSQLGRLPNVDWWGLDDEPLTLNDLAQLCRERRLDVIVVAADSSSGHEVPGVALERVWKRIPKDCRPGLVAVLFGGEETERAHAIRLARSPVWWGKRGLQVVCFSHSDFLLKVSAAIGWAASASGDPFRACQRADRSLLPILCHG